MTSDTNEKLHVQIGQVKTGREGQLLTAILGSCIGLGILHPDKGVYGLAHCLLSRSRSSSDEISGRHVDQAVKSLVSLMQISEDEIRKLKGICVGGANMTMPKDTSPERLVGSVNARTAYKALRELGIRNIYEDVGGAQGRQVNIDCTTGEFEVLIIPRMGV